MSWSVVGLWWVRAKDRYRQSLFDSCGEFFLSLELIVLKTSSGAVPWNVAESLEFVSIGIIRVLTDFGVVVVDQIV